MMKTPVSKTRRAHRRPGWVRAVVSGAPSWRAARWASNPRKSGFTTSAMAAGSARSAASHSSVSGAYHTATDAGTSSTLDQLAGLVMALWVATPINSLLGGV